MAQSINIVSYSPLALKKIMGDNIQILNIIHHPIQDFSNREQILILIQTILVAFLLHLFLFHRLSILSYTKSLYLFIRFFCCILSIKSNNLWILFFCYVYTVFYILKTVSLWSCPEVFFVFLKFSPWSPRFWIMSIEYVSDTHLILTNRLLLVIFH